MVSLVNYFTIDHGKLQKGMQYILSNTVNG